MVAHILCQNFMVLNRYHEKIGIMRKYDNITLLVVYGGVSLKYILNTVAKFSDIISYISKHYLYKPYIIF